MATNTAVIAQRIVVRRAIDAANPIFGGHCSFEKVSFVVVRKSESIQYAELSMHCCEDTGHMMVSDEESEGD